MSPAGNSPILPGIGEQAQVPAQALIPEQPTLPGLRAAAAGCHACDLYKTATQTVFGEGAQRAKVMFVGEQPGDQEDQQGVPFVGPAVVATIHPSAGLRAPDSEARRAADESLVADLKVVAKALRASRA